MITLYDTLTQTKKEIKRPKLFKKLRLYVCGPTVYDYVHVGNFRTSMVFDLLVRYMRSTGYKLSYLQNITDIDDKIIQRAKEQGMGWKELADKFTKIYLDQQKQLNITSVDRYERATDYIPQIVRQVKRLIMKGYGYEIEGDGWYFDISKFADYGKLAKRTVEQAEDGVSRIDQNDKKRNRGDFALWKYSPVVSNAEPKENEPSWESELGLGRPGWHIEDTAISEEIFGPQYEMHGGGKDLIFPHHEAEIAQQEASSGKTPFVKYWMHVGMLTSGGAKMSKSKGNFTTMKDFLEKFSPDTFRLMVLLAHYRSPMEFNLDIARDAEKNRNSITLFLEKLKLVKKEKGEKLDVASVRKDFDLALEDDFNTPMAFGCLFSLMNKANKNILELDQKTAKEIESLFHQIFDTFGFKEIQQELPAKVKELMQERELSRVNKQFDKSDALRKEIEALGYIVEDTAQGAVVVPQLKK